MKIIIPSGREYEGKLMILTIKNRKHILTIPISCGFLAIRNSWTNAPIRKIFA